MFFRLSAVTVALVLSTVAQAQTVTTAGACPGVVNINIQNFTPNGQYALLTGGFGGNDVIPAGPCAGTATQLNNLALRALGNLNAGGDANLNPNVPAGACAQALQVLDVGSCQLSAPTPIGAQCNLPNVALAAQGPAGQMTTPSYYGITAAGIVENGLSEDYTLHNNMLGTFPTSSTLRFTFFDVNFVELCTIDYDLSLAVPDPTFYTAYGGVTTDEVTLHPTNGFSTCGNVNPATLYGISDLRDYVGSADWSVGYGPMSAYLTGQLAAAVAAGGGNWNQDWAPYVFSMYVGTTGYGAFEVSYAEQFARSCDQVEVDNAGALTGVLAKPVGALDDFTSSGYYFVFGM